jgi:mono/diheme cytochrome c family protein
MKLLLACFLVAFTIGGAQAAQIGIAKKGYRLAREACAQCHLIGKEAGRSSNLAAPSFKAIANTPGITSAALSVALRTSHRTMPNIVIKGEDADSIIAYILNLKNSD